MQTIKPFIDLGWHTVPLQGELKRLSNGKKTLPGFPKNWNVEFAQTRNTDPTPLGGALTGQLSDIIAIDCDNTMTYTLFKTLDPSYGFHFVSDGKKNGLGEDQKTGTIIYKYVSELTEGFKLHNHLMSLDFYSTGGFVYLPTEANTTKMSFDMTELKEPPAEVIALLQSIRPVKMPSQHEAILQSKNWVNTMAPQLATFLARKKVIPNLFRMLTPKDFRDLPEYIEKGYLSPHEVPDGRGSEYLSKISAILGSDISVDVGLYAEAMNLINDLFNDPMPRRRLESTVIEPMVEERSSMNGSPIWQYDEDWEEEKMNLISKRNELLEAFYDPNRRVYYLVDILAAKAVRFDQETRFIEHIDTIARDSPGKKELKAKLPLVDAVSTPARPFGFFSDNEANMFNSFSPTVALQIFREPEIYRDKYSRPTTTIQFLESLIPDNYMRNYLLRFLRRKFDKFEYSPTVLFFLGVPGAGKDTLVKLIESIIGAGGMARPTTKEFLEMYNGWMLDKYFAQLDEYGNQLVRFDEKEQALGKIKAYTGKAQVQVRQMRTDGFNYEHNVTFIMTANKNPLFIEGDDRRMAIFDNPNKLANEPWVQSFGGVSEVIRSIEMELNDFVYYLSTEVDNLSLDEYMQPPETSSKKELIASKFGAAQRIAFLLSNEMFTNLEDLAHEYDVPKLFDGAHQSRMYEDNVFDLYYEMTEGKGTKRGLAACMKEFSKVPTTYAGSKAYYYHVPMLAKFTPKAFDEIMEE